MKETTKKKIIKTAKIAGMVMTAFFAVLGLLFSAAALTKCSGGEDRRAPLVTLNERAKLAPNNKNPLEDFVSVSWDNRTVTANTDSSLTIDSAVRKRISELSLEESTYLMVNYTWVIVFSVSNDVEYEHIKNVLDTSLINPGAYTIPELTTLEYFYLNNYSSMLLDVSEGQHWFVTGWIASLELITLTDLYNDPPIMSVNWGFQWFPWQMMGYAGSNPVILSDITGSFESQHLIEHRYLDGFYFRSNAKLYNKIDFMYSWASGSELTDGSGKFYTVSNANAWYLQEVRYYYGDGADEYDVVARFSIFESPTNHYNIPAYGPLAWVAPAFRQIDIVHIADENAVITTNTGSYTLSQWIEILLQPMSGDININVIQGGDPFSLMTTAFDSMKGILSIAVLPGISLGLLLFLPIIAGIIVIILRVVKR